MEAIATRLGAITASSKKLLVTRKRNPSSKTIAWTLCTDMERRA